MKGLLHAIESFAQALGGPGMLLIAYLDSSFLSFPQANDLLVIYMVLKNKPLMPYYAAMATLGSVLGCLTLHHLAARGGETFLRKRVRAGHVDRGLALYRRYGVLAVIVPSLLPPPAPFKLFVLLAGVSRMPRMKFAIAVALGRGFRYFGQGILAVLYGDQAIAFLREHGRGVSIGVGVAVLVAVAAFYIWRSRTRSAPMADAR